MGSLKPNFQIAQLKSLKRKEKIKKTDTPDYAQKNLLVSKWDRNPTALISTQIYKNLP